MNMPVTPSAKFRARDISLFWLAVIAAFIGFIWLFQSILTPFILGLVIAYLLNPLVLKLEGEGWPRWAAVLLLLVTFMMALAAAFSFLLPVLVREGAQLIGDLPTWITAAQAKIVSLASDFGVTLTPDSDAIVENIQGQAGQILQAGKGVLAGVLAGGAAIFSFVSFVFLMPIVAFYMLLDWPRLVAKIDELLPRDKALTARHLMGEIDRTLAGFIRGQLTVCLILGLFYGIGLTLIGLRFGFVIGMAAGVLSIMPYVGSAFGLFMSLGVAWFTTGSPMMVGAALVVFGIGQFVEGNFLTPKLVGDNIGLHPLWVIFALMAGGSLMGFVGLLIAVPVAAVIGVLVRFAFAEYKKSAYYVG